VLQIINQIIKDSTDFQENACLVGLVSTTNILVFMFSCGATVKIFEKLPWDGSNLRFPEQFLILKQRLSLSVIFKLRKTGIMDEARASLSALVLLLWWV
jgi:hypothetical protein